jgi:hypothetical protein
MLIESLALLGFVVTGSNGHPSSVENSLNGEYVNLDKSGTAAWQMPSYGRFFHARRGPREIFNFKMDKEQVGARQLDIFERSNYFDAFQISGPLSNYGPPVAIQTVFSNVAFDSQSNGHMEYTASYVPPDVNFNHVEVGWNVSGVGSQYDRLAHLYIGGCEIWRSSTAEPYSQVEFNYTKDVSEYLALFMQKQVIQFQLDNYIVGTTTGIYYVTLTISFYDSGSFSTNGPFPQGFSSATNIVPLLPSGASQQDSYGYMYSLPGSNTSANIGPLPRNTTRAVLDIGASGNGGEEFWYTGVITEYQNEVPGSFGAGPSRVIEVYVNNHLAGWVFPFPIIYTGGLHPEFWSPMVGINAFDVPRYQIDITPFLPTLWGSNTLIELKVVNGYSNEVINQNWWIDANLMTWETSGIQAQGTILTLSSDNGNPIAYGDPDGISYYQQVQMGRTIQNIATLEFGDSNYTVQWFQNGSYINNQMHQSNQSQIDQHTFGADSFSFLKSGQNSTYYQFSYNYPLTIIQNQSNIDYGVFRSYDVNLNGNSINAIQNATLVGNTTDTVEDYRQFVNGEFYNRYVLVSDGTVVTDVG